MTLQLEHDPFLDAVVDLRRAADRLARARDRTATDVDCLLDGGWRGEAAHAYLETWSEWLLGADAVIEGLAAMADLVQAAGRYAVEGDDVSRARLDRVAARIAGSLVPGHG